MIKITLSAMGHEANVEKYVLSKKNDEIGVVTSIDTEAVFEQPAFSELLEMTARGIVEEAADINILCGGEETTLEGLISHIEGKPNLKHCYYTKPVRFKTVYDCIKDIEINIFDYTPSPVETVPGDLQRDSYSNDIILNLGDELNKYTLEQVLSSLGGIPDRTASGWAVESIRVVADPQYILIPDPGGTGFQVQEYSGHNCTIFVSYIRAFSNTQLSPDWIELSPGAWYLNPFFFPSYAWKPPIYSSVTYYYTNYTQTTWEAGKYKLYNDISISNTHSLNDILIDIFNCSGKTLVSNFFNINPDLTEPFNSAYQYAVNFCHDIKIVQSFDIIRESALKDSFGISGKIEAKKLIKDLNTFFGLTLVYDSINDVLRYEHYSYFNEKGIDFVLHDYEYEVTDEFEVNRDVINVENWFMGADTPTDGFYTSKIDYKNYGVQSTVNEKSYKVENLITDVFGTLNNEDYTGDNYKKLFFLLSTDGTAIKQLNRPFAMRDIIKNLHNNNRPLSSGVHDGITTQFGGFSMGLSGEVKWFMNLPMFLKLNPGNTVKINYGTFVIEEIEFENETLTFKIKK
jgi:hypothetical protein